MFGDLQFITIFNDFLLPNHVALSAQCFYYFSTSNVLILRCNNILIFLWRFQCHFKLDNLMGNLRFKIAFLNDHNTLEIRPLHFLVVKCLDYHFMQSDLIGSGFLKALTV